MKKTYLSPMTRLVTVNTNNHLLELSAQLNASQATVDDSGDYNTLSRRGGSLWDDEDQISVLLCGL